MLKADNEQLAISLMKYFTDEHNSEENTLQPFPGNRYGFLSQNCERSIEKGISVENKREELVEGVKISQAMANNTYNYITIFPWDFRTDRSHNWQYFLVVCLVLSFCKDGIFFHNILLIVIKKKFAKNSYVILKGRHTQKRSSQKIIQ